MKKRGISLALTLLLSAASMFSQSYSSKVSPYLRQVTAEQAAEEQATNRHARATANQYVTVLTKLTDDADEQALAAQYDFEVLNRIGSVLIVRLPQTNIQSMAADDQVLRIEAERAPRPMLDVVPQQIQANKLHKGTSNQLTADYTGKGVIVGVVDEGFDYLNVFFDEKGSARSESNEITGTKTTFTPRIRWAGDYLNGNKYTTKNEIVAAQHSSDAKTSLHGTHVAGIAAGGKVSDNWGEVSYCGIAPGADLAVANVNLEASTTTGVNFTTTLQAMADIFEYAKEQGKPCVINFSAGDAMTFSNSRQLAEEAIRTLLSEPGRALVVASGNSGSSKRLAHKTADMTEGGAGILFNGSGYDRYFGVELKVKPSQTILLRYNGTTASLSFTPQEIKDAQGVKTLMLGTKKLTVLLREQQADYDIIYVTAGTATYMASDEIFVTIQGEGDAWIYADALCAGLKDVSTLSNHSLAQDGYSMTWPAQLPEVISVGSIANRLKIMTAAAKYSQQGETDVTAAESTKGLGYISKSSSAGPTLSEAMKPDVCAPGVLVVSALNNFIDENTEMAYAAWLITHLDTEFEENYGYSMALAQTGTSMAAPAVAGTIALWMQADPTLTTERIKDIIAHSSRQPDSELTYPNNLYGHGEINAYKGLTYLLDQYVGIEEVKSQRANANAAVYNLNGQLVKSAARGLNIIRENGKIRKVMMR
jgi:subtilisin family serine protease